MTESMTQERVDRETSERRRCAEAASHCSGVVSKQQSFTDQWRLTSGDWRDSFNPYLKAKKQTLAYEHSL